METKNENAETLKKLLNAVDPDRLDKKDFVKSFSQVVKSILAVEKRNLEAIAELSQTVERLKQRVQTETSLTLEDLQEEVRAAIAKIKDGKDGRDGRDGLDADPQEVAQLAAALIKLPEYRAPIMPGPQETRDMLELLQDDEKLTIDAVRGLPEKLDDLDKKIAERQSRGGGTSAIGVAQAFKYIAHTEEPVGAIDGNNTTYRVKHTIFWIAGFTLNGEQIAELPNFTYAGKTITFASALPAAYSGKDFEVKYIGH